MVRHPVATHTSLWLVRRVSQLQFHFIFVRRRRQKENSPAVRTAGLLSEFTAVSKFESAIALRAANDDFRHGFSPRLEQRHKNQNFDSHQNQDLSYDAA